MSRPILFTRIFAGFYLPANVIGMLVMVGIFMTWVVVSLALPYLFPDYSQDHFFIVMIVFLAILQGTMFIFGE